MVEISPQYLNVFDDLAATVPELAIAFRRHLSTTPNLWDKCSALATAVADLASANGLEPLVPFFEALVPVYGIVDEALSFYLDEGFMETLVLHLDYAHVPLSDVRTHMAGQALLAWDAAVDYMRPDSSPNAGA